MTKFSITPPVVQRLPVHRFYIGADTGTLFYLMGHPRDKSFVIIVGKGIFEGQEGTITDATKGSGVKPLPFGSYISIEA